jgi:hypothetical protein
MLSRWRASRADQEQHKIDQVVDRIFPIEIKEPLTALYWIMLKKNYFDKPTSR